MASELQIMIHAKAYLDKLANGINPLTDEALPETDIVNQVRISRCLFFVSDVLRQVIEKGGLKKPPKAVLRPFELTEEQAGSLRPLESPIAVSAVTERINSLVDQEKMKKLSYRSVVSFLLEEGFLTQVTDPQGKLKRQPTPKGAALGIMTENRTGLRGDYTAVLYDRNAQQYILDHLDRITQIDRAADKARPSPDPGQAP